MIRGCSHDSATGVRSSYYRDSIINLRAKVDAVRMVGFGKAHLEVELFSDYCIMAEWAGDQYGNTDFHITPMTEGQNKR
jgi:hypothetical protein